MPSDVAMLPVRKAGQVLDSESTACSRWKSTHLGARAGSRLLVAMLLLLGGPNAQGQAQESPKASSLLLTDKLGRMQSHSTNSVEAGAHPTAGQDVSRQIPQTQKGASQSDSVSQRIRESKSGREWFPDTPPILPPYLANVDEYGNTAIQSGALWPTDPVSPVVQAGKTAVADAGLRYILYQSLTMMSMTGEKSGSGTLQYYTATFQGKWGITEWTNAGRAGWISTEVNVQQGLSADSRAQLPSKNLGSIVYPQASVFGPNGIWISELAWQQALMDGHLVVLAGQMDQSNYIDVNAYANNSQGQFMNSAFVNSSVLPLPYDNLGTQLQYQESPSWYALLGMGANNQRPSQSPFVNLGFDNWSWVAELGWTPTNVFGLGPGAYRFQPFVATVGGVTQGGVGLNIQQQLGAQSPFGWFGRFGVGGEAVTLDGASAQVATGVVLQGPLQYAGMVPRLSNDLLGLAFVWSRPSDVMQPVTHSGETGLELMYVLQVTPTASLQPDLQILWDAVNNPTSDRCIVFQLQLNLTW